MWTATINIVDSRHQYAQEWKARTGGWVVGYLRTYVPEEMLCDAGTLLVRVMGSHEPQDITDRHIFPTMWGYGAVDASHLG